MPWGFARKKPTKKKQTYLTPRLRYRAQILLPEQTEEDAGGFEQTYECLRKIWMGFEPVTQITHHRWSNVETLGTLTHEGIARKDAFDIIDGLNPVRTEYYIMMEQSNWDEERLFRIRGMMDIGERHEYVSIALEEIEERGTGIQG